MATRRLVRLAAATATAVAAGFRLVYETLIHAAHDIDCCDSNNYDKDECLHFIFLYPHDGNAYPPNPLKPDQGTDLVDNCGQHKRN